MSGRIPSPKALGGPLASAGGPYRGHAPVDITFKDPFPSIRCVVCDVPTTSVCGEDVCARCDLEALLQGVNFGPRWWCRHELVNDPSTPRGTVCVCERCLR